MRKICEAIGDFVFAAYCDGADDFGVDPIDDDLYDDDLYDDDLYD